MSLADLNEQSVWEAIAEFNRVGRDAFLATNGFDAAQAWYVVVDDDQYDSKAIVGYAHGVATSEFWRSTDFTNGEQSVADRLRALGFDVRRISLASAEFHGYGEVPGEPIGTVYANRRELFDARVHRALQAGIVGTARAGAKSIVVSGGYEDDEDLGDVIVYTGHGGRDSSTRRQIADQSIGASGNAALVTSSLAAGVVRVIRGRDPKSPYAPTFGLRYDGLYRVDSWWMSKGQGGYFVCRYRMVAASLWSDGDVATTPTTIETVSPVGNPTPGRATQSVQRIVRSGPIAEHVKHLYDHSCQMCGIRLTVVGRGYSEAAHVRPLGRPHNGPDVINNVLCLCPNCHVLFDNGAVFVEEDLSLHWTSAPGNRRLTVVDQHGVNLDQLSYHRTMFEHPDN